MSDDEKQPEVPKLRLSKDLDSTKKTETESDASSTPESSKPEANPPRKSFKLKRPSFETKTPFNTSSRSPFKGTQSPFKRKTPPPFQKGAAPTPESQPAADSESTPPAPPTGTEKPATPPPPPRKQPQTSGNVPTPPPKRSQNFNPDDPFADVLPKPDPKTGRRTTRAPFPVKTEGESNTADNPSKVKTKRIFQNTAGKSAEKSSHDAGREFDRKLKSISKPGHSTGGKDSNHLTSILIILFLILILGAAVAGIWFVLGSDSKETSPAKTESSETAEAPAQSPKKEPAHKLPLQEAMEIINPVTDEKSTSSKEAMAPRLGLQESVTEFLNTVHIGGMRSGANARVMLNEVTYQVGDIVHVPSELRFEGIQDGRLVFKDKNGVLYMKSF